MTERALLQSERELLSVLDDRGGATTGTVADRWPNTYCRDNRRQRSAAVRSHLMELKRDGYVGFLDEHKPVCWVITAKGRAALQEMEVE